MNDKETEQTHRYLPYLSKLLL